MDHYLKKSVKYSPRMVFLKKCAFLCEISLLNKKMIYNFVIERFNLKTI